MTWLHIEYIQTTCFPSTWPFIPSSRSRSFTLYQHYCYLLDRENELFLFLMLINLWTLWVVVRCPSFLLYLYYYVLLFSGPNLAPVFYLCTHVKLIEIRIYSFFEKRRKKEYYGVKWDSSKSTTLATIYHRQKTDSSTNLSTFFTPH